MGYLRGRTPAAPVPRTHQGRRDRLKRPTRLYKLPRSCHHYMRARKVGLCLFVCLFCFVGVFLYKFEEGFSLWMCVYVCVRWAYTCGWSTAPLPLASQLNHTPGWHISLPCVPSTKPFRGEILRCAKIHHFLITSSGRASAIGQVERDHLSPLACQPKRAHVGLHLNCDLVKWPIFV